MYKVKDIYVYIDTFAPFNSAMDFDNVGILVGNPENNVKKCLLCLDVTKDAIEFAKKINANLLISHHPVIFNPLKRLMEGSVVSELLLNHISVISAHTNYDLSPIGVNYQLAEKIGLKNIMGFKKYRDTDLFEGYIGELNDSLKPQEFAEHIKMSLSCKCVSYTKRIRPVKRVAVGCGAGSGIVFDAVALNADAFVSGESKHHELLFANDADIMFVTAGHFETEVFAMEKMANILRNVFKDMEFIVLDESSPVLYI